MAHRFAIGTQYEVKTKNRRDVCVVEDQLTCTNSLGEVVERYYVTSHEFMGQKVFDRHVCDTTIARNLIHTPETQYFWTLTHSDGSKDEDRQFMTVALAMECNRHMIEIGNPWRWECELAPNVNREIVYAENLARVSSPAYRRAEIAVQRAERSIRKSAR